jgi:hypothetical protein
MSWSTGVRPRRKRRRRRWNEWRRNRLSHLLSLPSLSTLALAHYQTLLTSSNVAQELYSDFCGAYGEPREVAIEFAVQKWKEVEASEGLKKVEKRVKNGEGVQGTARTAMELCRRLVKRYGSS